MTTPATGTNPHSTSITTTTTTSSGLSTSNPPTSPSLPYPRDYSFPPFFTPQPNPTTHHAQCTKWAAWILAYCRHQRLWKLVLADAVETELFWNRKIERRLGLRDARDVLEWMRGQGRVEWVGGAGEGRGGGGSGGGAGGGEGRAGVGAGVGDGDVVGRNVCWVWWKTPEEWAVAIAEWVEETGQKNTVLTLYELTESEATISQEFHGMDPEVLQKALHFLVKRGKAQVFGQEDQQGVKFF